MPEQISVPLTEHTFLLCRIGPDDLLRRFWMLAELAGSCPFPIKTFPPDTLCQVIDNIGIDDHERPVHRSVLYMPEGGIHLQMIRKVPPQALDW